MTVLRNARPGSGPRARPHRRCGSAFKLKKPRGAPRGGLRPSSDAGLRLDSVDQWITSPALGAPLPFGESEKEDEGRPGAQFHRDAERWLMAEDNLRSMGNEQALTVVRSPRPLHRSGKSLYFAHPLWIPHNGRMVRSVLMRVGPARDPLFFVTRARRRRHARNRAGISCVVLMKQQPPARSAH
jgi:hypothetical protein